MKMLTAHLIWKGSVANKMQFINHMANKVCVLCPSFDVWGIQNCPGRLVSCVTYICLRDSAIRHFELRCTIQLSEIFEGNLVWRHIFAKKKKTQLNLLPQSINYLRKLYSTYEYYIIICYSTNQPECSLYFQIAAQSSGAGHKLIDISHTTSVCKSPMFLYISHSVCRRRRAHMHIWYRKHTANNSTQRWWLQLSINTHVDNSDFHSRLSGRAETRFSKFVKCVPRPSEFPGDANAWLSSRDWE